MITGLGDAAGIQFCFQLCKQALHWTKCIAEKNIQYTLKQSKVEPTTITSKTSRGMRGRELNQGEADPSSGNARGASPKINLVSTSHQNRVPAVPISSDFSVVAQCLKLLILFNLVSEWSHYCTCGTVTISTTPRTNLFYYLLLQRNRTM